MSACGSVHAAGFRPWHDHARPDLSTFAWRIGRGTKPCHVSNDCLAAADKTRYRAPFGGSSRATPVPLRHRMPRERPRLFSLPAHDVPPAIHRWHVGAREPSLSRSAFECLLCLTGTPGPFSGLRRTIFCTGPGMELCVVSPHQQHRSRLDASPCVVAGAGRRESSHSFGGRG